MRLSLLAILATATIAFAAPISLEVRLPPDWRRDADPQGGKPPDWRRNADPQGGRPPDWRRDADPQGGRPPPAWRRETDALPPLA